MPVPPLLPRRRAEQAGFTLLEVLVAFVIAALALGALFEGALGALRVQHDADRAEQALSRARSHLAVIGHGVALRPTTQEGDDGSGFRWRLSIRPAGTATGGNQNGNQNGGRLVLYAVRVEEDWSPAPPAEGSSTTADDTSHRLVLLTERLGSPPAGAEP